MEQRLFLRVINGLGACVSFGLAAFFSISMVKAMPVSNLSMATLVIASILFGYMSLARLNKAGSHRLSSAMALGSVGVIFAMMIVQPEIDLSVYDALFTLFMGVYWCAMFAGFVLLTAMIVKRRREFMAMRIAAAQLDAVAE